MFRDSQEELDRLTEELLEGEELPKADEDILNDELIMSLSQEIGEEEIPTPAEAPEEKEKKDPVVSVLTGVALLLMAGIFSVLIWWIIQIRSLI